METGGGAAFGGGGLLLQTDPPLCFVSFHRKKPPLPRNFKAPSFHCSRFQALRRSYIVSAGTRRRASNAETDGSQRLNFRFRDRDGNGRTNDDVGEGIGEGGYKWKRRKRKWWSDEPPEMAENEAEAGILEEAIDSIWIFKVFKSYGWILPPILLSMLLATGLKAFLIALALPVGQSLLTFMFQKLLGGGNKRKPKRKARKRRRPSLNTINDTDMDDEERDEESTMQEKMRYQSWAVGDSGSINKDAKDVPYFGGWDELDGVGAMRRPPQKAGHSHKNPSMKDKLSQGGANNDMPLLLRLLIAVFPFLGSWTKML